MSYELQQSLGITPLNCCAAATSRPPQQAILDRPLDLVLIGTLRDRLALPGASPPGWHRAATDPVEGAAVTAIHNAPSRPWAVVYARHEAQVSRAALARQVGYSSAYAFSAAFTREFHIRSTQHRTVMADAGRSPPG